VKVFVHVLFASITLATPLIAIASADQVSPDLYAIQTTRPISAVPVAGLKKWPTGHYFRVEFDGMATSSIIVNGYKANVVMLDNAPIAGRRFAIARLPEAAAVTGGFITFMVTSKTSQGYTHAVPLKIVLDSN
jgi:hypothetical protein